MQCIEPSFYRKSTIDLAQALLGTYVVLDTPRALLAGRIVETEAYLALDDPACHASRGKTARNAPMFGPAGRSYVYLIYGMYHCLNVVSGKEGQGEAVLIRALEPVAGIEVMQKRRGIDSPARIKHLCNGPGKLTQALGLTLSHNDLCLQTSKLRLYHRGSFGEPKNSRKKLEAVTTTRIGISQGAELLLRYYLADNDFISRPAVSMAKSSNR